MRRPDGILGAAVVVIYTEIAGLMLAAPAIVLIYRIIKEKPRPVSVLITASVGLTVMGMGAIFVLPTIPNYLVAQFVASFPNHTADGTAIGVLRPGQGDFPTLLHGAVCAWCGFYALRTIQGM